MPTDLQTILISDTSHHCVSILRIPADSKTRIVKSIFHNAIKCYDNDRFIDVSYLMRKQNNRKYMNERQ